MNGFASTLAGADGILLRRDAVARGIDDNALARMVKAGELVRMRHGAYAIADVWAQADAVTRHLMLGTAVLERYEDHVAASHTTASMIHGGPSWGLDLRSVHLTHFHGNGRRSSGIVHHQGACGVADVTRANGHWVTSPTRTVLDVCAIAPPEVGLVQANDFLHRELTSLEEIEQMESSRKEWPHSLGTNVVLRLADPRIESVGETRTLYLCWRKGLPLPEPQWKVFRPDGRLAGRVDFAWPEYRCFAEFDGMTKYLRSRREGETIEQAVLREKQREDLIRELTGWRFIRLIWADLAHPERTAARIMRFLALAA